MFRSLREGSVGKRSVQEKWKVGAKKALLQWVQSQLGKNIGFQVKGKYCIYVWESIGKVKTLYIR